MHGPDLLVLDEPTPGLDPLIQQTFYTLVAEAAQPAPRSSSRRTSCRRFSTSPTAWR